ncbi:AAA family ATPase [Parasutterella sp.]|uniref:AAA family ATPase n=1 Tax=Parasutterella sp. TaxID=2049037 RepID=UPI0039934191
MIVVIAHIKGGTGKTTTAVQLALQRQIDYPERRIWLVDADEQQSALDTATIRSQLSIEPPLACSSFPSGEALAAQMGAQAKNWDDIIIDCGGRDSDALRIALMVCDKLVVPVLPRAYDVWSLSRLEAVIENAQNLGAKFETLAFLNRMDKTAESREAAAILDGMKHFRLLNTSLSDRVAYAKAVGNGRSVFEMKPRDKKACEELENLSSEIFK